MYDEELFSRIHDAEVKRHFHQIAVRLEQALSEIETLRAENQTLRARIEGHRKSEQVKAPPAHLRSLPAEGKMVTYSYDPQGRLQDVTP